MSKDELRKQIVQERSLQTLENEELWSTQICEHLEQFCKKHTFNKVCGFFPMPHEVQILPFLTTLLLSGIELYIPVIKDREQMHLLPITTSEDLIEKSKDFSIHKRFPEENCLQVEKCPNLDLCLVPSLALDTGGNRLGYGMGYYDRFLMKLKILSPNCKITAPQFQYLVQQQKIPAEHTDVKICRILTETSAY